MTKIISLFVWLVIFLLILLVGRSFWQAYQPTTQRMQGQIEARQYTISSKIAGRIDKVLVRKGDNVVKQQLIFTLLNPELTAKLEQAKAGSEAASALEKEAYNGARKQQILMAKNNWEKAKVATVLAKKTARRITNLFNNGVIEEQKKDEANTQLDAALFTEKSAYQMYTMVKEGTREEIRLAAQAKAHAAREAVAEVEVYFAETQVKSWHNGEVAQILLNSGEIAPAGFPVVSIMDMQDVWAVFHVREDQLSAYKMGTILSLIIPALGEGIHQFKVSHVSVMGDFATWRTTQATQGFDMRTFEVEARPDEPIKNVRAGMSVLIQQ